MAAIDKTYTRLRSEYVELKEWARHFKILTPSGQQIDLSNRIYDWKDEDFDGTERPVMNTGWVEDYYLIKNCPLKFVTDNLKAVYDEDYYNSIKNGTSEWDTFSREGKEGTRVRIVKHPRPYRFQKAHWGGVKKVIHGLPWHISVDMGKDGGYLWYNEDLDKWFWNNELGVGYQSYAYVKSIRALIRKIRKWKLPKGAIVTATDRWYDDDWEFLVI